MQASSMLKCIEELTEFHSAKNEEGCQIKNRAVDNMKKRTNWIVKFAKQWQEPLGWRLTALLALHYLADHLVVPFCSFVVLHPLKY